MLAQVTMVDTTRIALYEDYSARLTDLILHNFISNSSAKRRYFFKRQDTGEFVDVEGLIKDDKYNYAALLGILCRKDKEIYDDDFIADKLDDRIKMFEELSIDKAL